MGRGKSAKGLICKIDGCSRPVRSKLMCNTHYMREYTTGNALTKVNPARQVLGKSAEISVGQVLKAHGRTVQLSPHYTADFDLLVDGKRVDVKCSTPHTDKWGLHWFINIIHWGELSEDGKDLYIFRLEQVPHMDEPVHLLFRAPVRRPSIRITMRQLLGQYAGAIADFYAFARGEFQNKSEAA